MVDIRVNPRPSAFQATVTVDPGDEDEVLRGLTLAIGEAAKAAAGHLQELGIREETLFSVSSIQVAVSPNPGPKAYVVTITPGG